MRVRPNKSDWCFADEIFRRYSAKDGSGSIASPISLAHLSACLRALRPQTVLEMGAGIGTITDALLSHENGPRRLVSFENNKFCLGELAKNIAHHDRARLTIVADGGRSPIIDADMIVADGWDGAAEAYKAVRPGTVIFMEGGRRKLRAACSEALESDGLAVSFTEYGAIYKFKIGWGFERKRWRRLWLPKIWRAHRVKGCWIGQVTAADSDYRSHSVRAA